MNVHLVLFLVSLFYGILFSWAGEIMPKYLNAEALVWMRIAFATLAFHLIGVFGKSSKIDWKNHGLELAICGFFGTSSNMYLFFKGLQSTFPINAAVLMLATPLFVAIFDHIRLKAQPKTSFMLALMIAAMGCFKLLTENNNTFTRETRIGDLLVLINAIFYAIYLVRIKKLTASYPPITLNKWTFSFGFLFITPLGIPALMSANFNAIPNPIWGKIIYILVVMSFLVYFMNAYAVKIAGPTLTGIYIYLQPLLATIIAFILQTDSVSLMKVVWILVVLIATFYATRKSPKAKIVVATPD